MTTKKRTFPPAFDDEGGKPVPHTPSDEEMENCAFAQKAKTECPRKKDTSINCGNCVFQKELMKRMFVKV